MLVNFLHFLQSSKLLCPVLPQWLCPSSLQVLTGQDRTPVSFTCVLSTTALHNTLQTVHFTLHIAHCTLYTVHCTLYTAHGTLYTAHFTLYTVHCTLHCSLHCRMPRCPLHLSILIRLCHYTRLIKHSLNSVWLEHCCGHVIKLTLTLYHYTSVAHHVIWPPMAAVW